MKDDVIVKIEPASFPEAGFDRICLKGIAMATQRLKFADRLTHPMIRSGERGEGEWQRVTWDEAYEYIAVRLNRIAAEHGWRATSWHSSTGNYGFKCLTSPRRVTNCLGGTYFTSTGLSSDWAGFTAYIAALGHWAGSNEFSDAEKAKYILNIGKNIADTAHSDMHFVFDAMEKGCKMVVVDPRFSRTAAKADEWISPRPGSDAAMALGLIHVVIVEGLFDDDYVRTRTNLPFLVRVDTKGLLRERDCIDGGGEAFMVWDAETGAPVTAGDTKRPKLSGSGMVTCLGGRSVECVTAFDANWAEWREFTPEYAASICEITADQIRAVAREYAAADPAWIWLGLGPQRYVTGHIVFRAYITLAALCGNIGKPYAGVNFVDGPFVALSAATPTEWIAPGGKTGHTEVGTKIVDIIASGNPYPVKSLWVSATNFASQTPFFQRFVREALPKLDLFVVSETVMTDAAAHADVVLPCVSYYEDDWDLVPGGDHWFVQLRRRAIPPTGESRNDFDIFKGLCERLGKGEDWQGDAQEICRRFLSDCPDPRFNQIDWEGLVRDGVARIVMERPHVPFKSLTFNTPSGRIELYQEQFADIGEEILKFQEASEGKYSNQAKKFPLHLITYKHVHSVHSTHTILPYIQEVLPGPKVEIAPADAKSRGIDDLDEVIVFNGRGAFRVTASISTSVPPGTLAMAQGWWKRHFASGHPQELTHMPHSEFQARLGESNWAAWDMMCDVRKAQSM